ncbi:unnamed protein product [Jaminaea pallidilutea]
MRAFAIVALMASALAAPEAMGANVPAIRERQPSRASNYAAADLYARQDNSATQSSSARASASSSSSSASASSSSGSATGSGTGGSVNVTQPSSSSLPDGCSMSNKLSAGQSASWTKTTASSCCTNATASTCFFRTQTGLDESEACTIPDCTELSSGDESKMAGFKPLSSTTGSGANNNTFKIQGSGSAPQLDQRGTIVVAATSLALLCVGFSTLL